MPQNFIYRDQDPNYALMGAYVQYGAGGPPSADRVAPVVNVTSPNVKVATYKTAKLDDHTATALGPRDGANEVTNYAPTFADKAVKRYGLKAGVTREVQLSNGPLGNLQATGDLLVSQLRLGIEKSVKTLLDGNGNAASAPTVKWDATSGTIKIEKDVDDAREAFLKKCGYEANLMVVPPHISKVMKRDSTIRDLRKYTDPSLIVNGDLPSSLWGLNIVIPGALNNTANPGAAQSVARVWADNTVYLLYVDPSMAQSGAVMTAVAQFRYSQWGYPFGIYTWADPDPTVKVTWIAAEVCQVASVVCADAIYRIPTVLT